MKNIINAIMKRYYEEDKEVLWEFNFHGDLYDCYAGTKGIYRSKKDGVCFYAAHHINELERTGPNYLVILPEDIVAEALTKKYTKFYGGAEHYEIDPEYYLMEARYIY